MQIEIELTGDAKDVLRNKLNQLLTDTKNHNKVLRDSATAVGGVITDYVPRSERPPSVHHLQDFEVNELGVIRWFGNYPSGNNYAQRVYFNKENHTFHVRYPGHTPQSHWLDVLYDRGIMSQVEEDVKEVLKEAADKL